MAITTEVIIIMVKKFILLSLNLGNRNNIHFKALSYYYTIDSYKEAFIDPG
jgi:hypothetical protein